MKERIIDEFFVSRLVQFGFTSKEVEVYLHLIKHGPKTVAALSRSLHTYREQCYRSLVSLQAKGAVVLVLDKRGVYAAVPTKELLKTELYRYELDFQEKEQLAREIIDARDSLIKEPLGTGCRFQLLHSLSEIGAHSLQIVDSAISEVLLVIPSDLLYSTMQTMQTAAIDAAKRDVDVRAIIDTTTSLRSQGKNLHICPFGNYDGVCFLSVDSIETITFIHWEQPVRLHYKNVSAFYCDDPSYANHLKSIFGMIWGQLADPKTAKRPPTV